MTCKACRGPHLDYEDLIYDPLNVTLRTASCID